MEKSPEKIQTHVLTVVRKFLVDSGAERASRGVSIEAQLERDLGIGSLEKAELFHRLDAVQEKVAALERSTEQA